MLRIKKLSEVFGKAVYTDEGNYFGEVEEVNLLNNKVESWRIKVGKGITSYFNGARGVIIPHNYVKAIGDVFVINALAMPSGSEPDEISELSEGNEF
jgi:sporulation protein YlmC with PRC-barrel domain